MITFPVGLLPLDCLPGHFVSESSHDGLLPGGISFPGLSGRSLCERILARCPLGSFCRLILLVVGVDV